MMKVYIVCILHNLQSENYVGMYMCIEKCFFQTHRQAKVLKMSLKIKSDLLRNKTGTVFETLFI